MVPSSHHPACTPCWVPSFCSISPKSLATASQPHPVVHGARQTGLGAAWMIASRYRRPRHEGVCDARRRRCSSGRCAVKSSHAHTMGWWQLVLLLLLNLHASPSSSLASTPSATRHRPWLRLAKVRGLEPAATPGWPRLKYLRGCVRVLRRRQPHCARQRSEEKLLLRSGGGRTGLGDWAAYKHVNAYESSCNPEALWASRRVL